MTPGSFRKSWPYFAEEIYLPLANLEEDSPPNDMFSEIGRLYMGVVSNSYNEARRDIESNIDSAFGVLSATRYAQLADIYKDEMGDFEKSLSGIQDYENLHQAIDILIESYPPSFLEERHILHFLEELHGLISDYGKALAVSYCALLDRFKEKYGLAYEIRMPFEIRPLISAEFSRMYQALRAEKGRVNGDLLELLSSFEHSYGAYVRNGHNEDLKHAIDRAFCFLEGSIGEKINKRGKTLSDLAKECERTGLLPHKGSLANSLNNLYGFPSNYPHLRHAGQPRSKLRDLEKHDCIALSLMALLWAGYVNSLPAPPKAIQTEAAE
jgi:hypothetical protein